MRSDEDRLMPGSMIGQIVFQIYVIWILDFQQQRHWSAVDYVELYFPDAGEISRSVTKISPFDFLLKGPQILRGR